MNRSVLYLAALLFLIALSGVVAAVRPLSSAQVVPQGARALHSVDGTARK